MIPNYVPIDAQNFLDAIHGSNAKINFRCIKAFEKYPIPLYGTFKEIKNKLQHHNDRAYDVYFTVNAGGTKAFQINSINAAFGDFDTKDKIKRDLIANGFSGTKHELDKEAKRIADALSDEELAEYKNYFLEQIRKFKCRPSLIIETRNGFHVYWLVDEKTTLEHFEECELRIIQHFGCDEVVKDLARVLRVPDFFWTKNPERRFLCKVVHFEEIRYNIQELIDALPAYSGELKKTKYATSPQLDNLTLIKKRDHEQLQQRLLSKSGGSRNLELNSMPISPTNQVKVNSLRELFDYLKCQDLRVFLDLYSHKFCCHFHHDRNPSANIYRDDSGRYWYKCFSSNCNVRHDIVSLVEHFQKCDTSQALRFLKNVYNIHLIESEWQLQQKEKYDMNLYHLDDIDRFSTLAPNAYKRIKNYLSVLIAMNILAKKFLQMDNFVDSYGNSLFYIDLKRLMRITGIKKDELLSQRLAILTYFGFIKKVPMSEIPKFLLNRAKHLAAKQNHKFITQYYSIPSYNAAILTFAEDKAKEWKSKNMSVKGFTRDMLLLTVGGEEANRVYPQLSGRQIAKTTQDNEKIIANAFLDQLDSMGYATEKEALEYFKGGNERKKVRTKQVLQSVLDKHNLVRIQATKEIKEKFKINSKGYPYIILRNENFSEFPTS